MRCGILQREGKVDNYVTTEERSAYQKERRQTLRNLHRCTYCAKKDAYTLAGRAICADCAEKKRDKERERRKATAVREQMRKNGKARRERLSAAGLCIQCGRRKAEEGHKRCKLCMTYQRRDTQRRRDRKAVYTPDEYCTKCKTELHLPGKKVCQGCYDVILRNLEKARAADTRHTCREAVGVTWKMQYNR